MPLTPPPIPSLGRPPPCHAAAGAGGAAGPDSAGRGGGLRLLPPEEDPPAPAVAVAAAAAGHGRSHLPMTGGLCCSPPLPPHKSCVLPPKVVSPPSWLRDISSPPKTVLRRGVGAAGGGVGGLRGIGDPPILGPSPWPRAPLGERGGGGLSQFSHELHECLPVT